jgi:D-3-phosphoglycerate dehydrogenase / 2-oxoglutarate reductase
MYKLDSFRIQTLNKIASIGLDRLPRDTYEIASEIPNPDAILVRSAKMHDMSLPSSLKAIARAGAGVNNIPIEKCTERGIIVFNTPGANANAVKELVIAGLLLSSRRIIQGIEWERSLIGKGGDVPKLIEDGKGAFAGPEIQGKTLGVIGLGAIGVLVANTAQALGMKVIGYDPYISVESAWGLSHNVVRATGLETLLRQSDYISLHTPLTDTTKGYIGKEKFEMMKKGARILNFARGGLVNNVELLEALNEGKVSYYVTDFPDEQLLMNEKVINIPHLGASTYESEDNCAVMAVDQIKDYLENGNIRNSVNFPNCDMERNGGIRLLIANKNIPKMIGYISAILAEENINIANMLNRHRDNVAYNIIDIDSDISLNQVEKIKQIEGIIMVRVLPAKQYE